jgi:hypothetical protein
MSQELINAVAKSDESQEAKSEDEGYDSLGGGASSGVDSSCEDNLPDDKEDAAEVCTSASEGHEHKERSAETKKEEVKVTDPKESADEEEEEEEPAKPSLESIAKSKSEKDLKSKILSILQEAKAKEVTNTAGRRNYYGRNFEQPPPPPALVNDRRPEKARRMDSLWSQSVARRQGGNFNGVEVAARPAAAARGTPWTAAKAANAAAVKKDSILYNNEVDEFEKCRKNLEAQKSQPAAAKRTDKRLGGSSMAASNNKMEEKQRLGGNLASPAKTKTIENGNKPESSSQSSEAAGSSCGTSPMQNGGKAASPSLTETNGNESPRDQDDEAAEKTAEGKCGKEPPDGSEKKADVGCEKGPPDGSDDDVSASCSPNTDHQSEFKADASQEELKSKPEAAEIKAPASPKLPSGEQMQKTSRNFVGMPPKPPPLAKETMAAAPVRNAHALPSGSETDAPTRSGATFVPPSPATRRRIELDLAPSLQPASKAGIQYGLCLC